MPSYGEHDDERDNYLPSACARDLLPMLYQSEVHRILRERGMALSELEQDILYTHYLVARGDFSALVDYLDSLDADTRRTMVNTPLYDTYMGTTLHTCAYWNTGLTALAIYRYLVGAGATPLRDSYNDLPWEVRGSRWICPVRGFAVSTDRRQDVEFAWTHEEIERYFAPSEPSVPSAPQSAT
jgi:hypothetical protein